MWVIDPPVVAAARAYFCLPDAPDRLAIKVADGSQLVRQPNGISICCWSTAPSQCPRRYAGKLAVLSVSVAALGDDSQFVQQQARIQGDCRAHRPGILRFGNKVAAVRRRPRGCSRRTRRLPICARQNIGSTRAFRKRRRHWMSHLRYPDYRRTRDRHIPRHHASNDSGLNGRPRQPHGRELNWLQAPFSDCAGSASDCQRSNRAALRFR